MMESVYYYELDYMVCVKLRLILLSEDQKFP